MQKGDIATMTKVINNKYQFTTKAKTLEFLSPVLKLSKVPKLYYFSAANWREDADYILSELGKFFGKDKVIVRSSAYTEDDHQASLAGIHDSVPNVSPEDKQSLSDAINKVMDSYRKSSDRFEPKDQVLVQLMINNVSMSGVIFTQDLNTGAPYYVINYDDETGLTDTVTAGKENSNRTLLVNRDAIRQLRSERFKSLLLAVKEIEQITGDNSLDIEYAVSPAMEVYIFQVRRISTKPIWSGDIASKVNEAIKNSQDFIERSFKPRDGLYGDTTLFGRMPDWNPAEMIGTSPRPLAISLYKHLITNHTWREARKLMGYYEPKGVRLMISLCGQPYIDVRASFNSFLPSDLNPVISQKLVNAWIKRLAEHKELQDKIEFDVAITALSLDFKNKISTQIPGILNKDEENNFYKSLLKLTDNLISGRVASLENSLQKIEALEERRKALIASGELKDLSAVSSLLEDCVRWGTLPFSILARHAFIAKDFLRSFVSCGLATESQIDSFQKSIKTIATEVVDDFDRLICQQLTAKEFMSKYGHLRPGTYDIVSKRYDKRDDLINGNIKRPLRRDDAQGFSFSKEQLKQIDEALGSFGFSIKANQLLEYIAKAIQAREYAKFIFTKNVSDALELIAAWGENIGLNREELSFISLKSILDTMSIACDKNIEQHLRDIANQEKQRHEITMALSLPYIIETPEDVAIVPLLLNKPNFITKKIVRGNYVLLDGKSDEGVDISDCIVLIEGADPGFDWIFSRSIKGLITKYGGANSHMAIRCAEFGIPAAIGCGEQIFDRVLRSRAIEINCVQGNVISIEA